MEKEPKQALSAALVEVRGVENAIIPNVIALLEESKDSTDFTEKLINSPGIVALNPAIIPNIIATVKDTLGELDESMAAKAPAPVNSKQVEPKKLSAKDKKVQINLAVEKCMEEGDKDKLTGGGIPKVEVISEMVGFDITATERDEAVRAYAKK
jgi:hypothetical protein